MRAFIYLGAGAVSWMGVAAWPELGFAAWPALVLLLHAARALAPFPGLIYVWMAFFLALTVGLGDSLPLPFPAKLPVTATTAIFATLPFVCDRLLVPHGGGGWLAHAVFPVAWVAVEFAVARLTPYSTWGALAYTQVCNKPLLQVASITGLFGVSFMVACGVATIDTSWETGALGLPAAVYGLALMLILGFGVVRLRSFRPGRAVRVAALTHPTDLMPPDEMPRLDEGRITPEEYDGVRAKLACLQEWFLDTARREARAGARLVAWAEGNLLVLQCDEQMFLQRAAALAREEGVYLLMGLATIHDGSDKPFENKAILLCPDGSTAFSYRKSRPVPGWEAGIIRRGDGRLPAASTSLGRLGAAICFELDFPHYMRQLGRAGIDLLIVPANDWLAIKQRHLDMAIVRAVENGTPMLRAASSGVSAAVDRLGRVLASSDAFVAGGRALVAQLPLGGVRTFYGRVGDVFAWLCTAALAAFIFGHLVARS